jgi:hypothetical protein
MAHMVKRLTNEGCSFLGEKIIEVRRVGPPQEVWYKLGKTLTLVVTPVLIDHDSLSKMAPFFYFVLFHREAIQKGARCLGAHQAEHFGHHRRGGD